MTVAATFALAVLVGGTPTGYVIDNVGLLNPMTVQELDAVLYQHEVETSNQVVVETIASLGGEFLEDYTLRRAMALRIGQKKQDNGVYVLISRDDRKMRIEVGYGLEGVLPDVVCARIIREQMTPRFREGSYDEGVTAGVNTILAAIRGEYTAGPLDRLYAVVPLDRVGSPRRRTRCRSWSARSSGCSAWPGPSSGRCCSTSANTRCGSVCCRGSR